MSRETPFLSRRLLYFLWGAKLTRYGQMLVVFGLLAGSFLSVSLETLSFDLFAVLFALGALTLLANALWRVRLQVELRLPDKAAAGTTVRGIALIRNVGRLPAYDAGASFFRLPTGLRAVPDEVYAEAIAPGECAEIPVAFEVKRRGGYLLPPLRAFSAFPWRLLRSNFAQATARPFLGLPAFMPADDLRVPVGLRYQPGGVALAANVGESPDYIGNREYRPGDSIRRVDMRAWGRVGEPVVREYHEEYYLRVALVLDTFAPGPFWRRRRRRESLEAGISLTATLTDGMARGECLLDIFAAGPRLYNFRAGRGAFPFEHVLDILACLDACPRHPFAQLAPALADELDRISSVLFVLLDWDEARRALVRTAVERGCRCRVFVVSDHTPTLPPTADDGMEMAVLTPAQIREGRLDSL